MRTGLASRVAPGIPWLARAVLALGLGACTGVIGSDPEPGPDRSVEIQGPPVLPHVQLFANASCSATEACQISTYNGHHPMAARALDILVSDGYGSRPSDDDALGRSRRTRSLINPDTASGT